MNKRALVFAAILISGLIIGCGGDGATSTLTGTTASTTGITTTGGTNTGGTTAASVGNYSGAFAGTNTEGLSYTGTGTGTIGAGAATFAYTAVTTGSAQYQISRNFTGTIDSTGKFTGTTPQAPENGGAVENFPATGTLTTVSSTEVKVTLNWAFPNLIGTTPAYTSTETWDITLQQ